VSARDGRFPAILSGSPLLGIEELRICRAWCGWQNETFLQQFTLDQLVALWRHACRHPELGEFADTWERPDIDRALARVAPTLPPPAEIVSVRKLTAALEVMRENARLIAMSIADYRSHFTEHPNRDELLVVTEALRHIVEDEFRGPENRGTS